MLTASKMTAHSVEYYESTVDRQPAAIGTDLTDYYSERGEVAPRVFAVGRVGVGAEATTARLGVSVGEALSREQVEGWFSQTPTAPGSGEVLGNKVREDGLHGWDLTVSAPKSVSMLWALGSQEEHEAVAAAHEAATDAALAYLGEHATYTRQRVPGVKGVGIVRADGLAGVRYDHRTSRAEDPHLHTHVLVSNKVLAPDGSWKTIDGTSLMHELRAAGTVYQASLRAELTRSLGVEWQRVDPATGLSELANVAREDVEAWSQRHTQIDAWLAEQGIEGSAAAQQAAQKATRVSKSTGKTTTELRAQWMDDERARGLSLHDVYRPHVDAGEREQVAQRDAEPVPRTVLEELAARRSTWTRADAVEVIAALMPPDADPSTLVERVEALADEAIGEAISLEAPARQVAVRDGLVRMDADRRPLEDREGTRRWTTTGTVEREAAAVGRAGAVADLGVDERWVTAAGLSGEQEAAMRSLVSSPSRASVLVAPAGAGKTHSLNAARRAWEAGGREVVALAPTGAAADVMVAEGVATRADTVATALGEANRREHVWAPGTVVVVDEAGMIGSADLAQLIEQAERDGSRMVLVGDPAQLQAPGSAGGLLGLLAETLPDTAELEQVWRQADPEERSATLAVREGDEAEVAQAVAWYRQRDRLAIGSTASMVEAAWDGWAADMRAGTDSLLMAPTWEVAEGLSARAQAWLIQAGVVEPERGGVQLGDESHPGRGEVAHVGDVIVTRRNDYALTTTTGAPVRTSNRWVVEGIDDSGRAAVRRVGGEHEDERVVLPAEYLAQHARLGYGVTIHSAQGATVTSAHAILDAARTDRSSAYVGITRGRSVNRVYIVDDATAAVEVGASRAHADAADAHVTHNEPERWNGMSEQAADRLSGIVARDRRDHAAHTVLRRAVREEATRQAAEYGIEAAVEHEQLGEHTPAGQVLAAERTRLDRQAQARAELREQLAASMSQQQDPASREERAADLARRVAAAQEPPESRNWLKEAVAELSEWQRQDPAPEETLEEALAKSAKWLRQYEAAHPEPAEPEVDEVDEVSERAAEAARVAFVGYPERGRSRRRPRKEREPAQEPSVSEYGYGYTGYRSGPDYGRGGPSLGR